MTTTPYYDQKLTREQGQALLKQSGAQHVPARSKPGILVYSLRGGGEGMVEKSGNLLRIRLFKGQCAC